MNPKRPNYYDEDPKSGDPVIDQGKFYNGPEAPVTDDFESGEEDPTIVDERVKKEMQKTSEETKDLDI